MDAVKTILSAGLVIRSMLVGDAGVNAITQRVFPVVSESEALLPYVVYNRQALDSERVKTGRPADTASMAVTCYASSYSESVELAEAVRQALDGKCATMSDGYHMRSCQLVDSTESWESDAYIQIMIFEIKI